MLKRAVHPGEVLKDELGQLRTTLAEFARQIDLPANRVRAIIDRKRSVDGDAASRLGHWFGVEPQFWLNLQTQFDLVMAASEAGDSIRPLADRSRDTRDSDEVEP